MRLGERGRDALDNRSDPACALGPWSGELVHDGRLHPPSAGGGGGGGRGAADPGTLPGLTWNTRCAGPSQGPAVRVGRMSPPRAAFLRRGRAKAPSKTSLGKSPTGAVSSSTFVRRVPPTVDDAVTFAARRAAAAKRAEQATERS